jgi:hypothetical protein
MQKPINEQYFDLWVELDEIWKKTSIEELTDWSKSMFKNYIGTL